VDGVAAQVDHQQQVAGEDDLVGVRSCLAHGVRSPAVVHELLRWACGHTVRA
jgi:hypothetical protein